MRQKPALHPDGLTLSGTVSIEPKGTNPWSVPFLDEPGSHEAVVRWSRAVGLPGALPDGMGLAVHVPRPGGQNGPFDLLMTSSGSSRLTRHLPLPRVRGDGPYSTLTSYRFPDRKRVVGAFPLEPGRRLPAALGELAAALRERPAVFRLCAAGPGEAWRPFATLTVRAEPPSASHSPSGFDPYVACLPKLPPGRRLGLIRHAAYAGSRRGRIEAEQDGAAESRGRVLALATFGAYAGGWALLARRYRRDGADPVTLSEVLLTGTATFRLSRLIGKAKVTRPLRAPFTDVEEEGAPAELNEGPKPGHRTVGELLSCPFCLNVWTATTLTGARMLWPRIASATTRTLSAVAIADAMHLGYAALVKATEADDPSD
ncbi:DUF1360 domain-containing protein [Streptomyces sp. A1136]|uniref:DUF1360 domain-containing protein n=1 Tax=Streptomyces sp. A1136 TaxID=2563102 RepID=UPI00109E9D09|nr:DUF1360 domain-containing protein [Streptomyces sp. A1136]THA50162.1 DUF1360 domain-containing protein [Streptomyces sp. A1136]